LKKEAIPILNSHSKAIEFTEKTKKLLLFSMIKENQTRIIKAGKKLENI